MQVTKPLGSPVPVSKTAPVAAAAEQDTTPTVNSDTTAPQPRTDGVELSDEGLALAQDASSSTETLDPARAQDIRAKIASGAYLTTDAADQVARALLRQGDV